MDKGREHSNDVIKEGDRIIALALIKYLYNQGKISELVFRNIKKETMKKISVENIDVVC